MFHAMAFFLSIICCSESSKREKALFSCNHRSVCLCVFVVFHNCSTCLLFFLATFRFYLHPFFVLHWRKNSNKKFSKIFGFLFSVFFFFANHKNLPRRAKLPHARWDMTISFNGKTFLYFQYLFLCILNENYFDFSPFTVCLKFNFECILHICMPHRRQ